VPDIICDETDPDGIEPSPATSSDTTALRLAESPFLDASAAESSGGYARRFQLRA
jgi:hypothetical protein